MHDYLRKLALFKNIPLFPTLEVTYCCGMKCVHCYRPQDDEVSMPLTRWKSLLAELKNMGTLGVVLTGGEPLDWPHLRPLIQHLRSLRMAFLLKTNGWSLDKDTASFLARHHVNEVHFSLYGAGAVSHDAVTGRPGSFVRVLRALERCLAHGITPQISCILLRQNWSDYDRVAQLARRYGVEMGVNPVIAPSAAEGINYKRIRITREQLRQHCRSQFEGEGLMKVLRLPTYPVCSAARSNCSIAPDGKVYPCNGYWYDCKADSVARRDFADVWTNSPLLKKVRGITAGDLKHCSACRFFEYCPRCLGMGHAETGRFTGVSPGDCLYARCYYETYRRQPLAAQHGAAGSFAVRCY
jgi:radical SAM protein with 4Fe4S-binding SPASM domain